MSFTGKATYSAGATLPEIAEDVSGLIGIVSPYETPLLGAIGDPLRSATGTYHEWLEDSLLPNKDKVSRKCDVDFPEPIIDRVPVDNIDRFRLGDQLSFGEANGDMETCLVTHIDEDLRFLTVVRQYAGSPRKAISYGSIVNILGNAAMEGGDRPEARFNKRGRFGNYTQLFTRAVEVSEKDISASQLGLSDEMDFQKQEKLRELIRDLENSVINGGMCNGLGMPDKARQMAGIISRVQTNTLDAKGKSLAEDMINQVLQAIWENSNGNVDLVVVGGFQKRKINGFLSGSRSYDSADTTFRDMVSFYESDFGVCRIVTTRWMPQDAAMLLDSSRINVLPLAGRSFHFKPLASGGGYECGELIGEYTLELKNETAHGVIRNLSIC